MEKTLGGCEDACTNSDSCTAFEWDPNAEKCGIHSKAVTADEDLVPEVGADLVTYVKSKIYGSISGFSLKYSTPRIYLGI